MPLQLDDLNLLDAPNADAGGRPLLLPVDAIDEDPAQPRREFDEESLQELAETIAQRGVRQPVSVRHHPGDPGRWMLNFGARRLRASRLAGKADIPAFLDETADSYDQVIENEQREPLKPLELALFVQRRMAEGDSQAEIGRRLGKSRGYINFATALIDPPDWLLAAYREGRCRGLLELYELRRMHEDRPGEVEAWVSSQERITRAQISALRATLEARNVPDSLAERDLPAQAGEALVAEKSAAKKPSRTAKHARPSLPRLAAELDGVTYELIVNRAPSVGGEVFVRTVAGTNVRSVSASSLKLLGFLSL